MLRLQFSSSPPPALTFAQLVVLPSSLIAIYGSMDLVSTVPLASLGRFCLLFDETDVPEGAHHVELRRSFNVVRRRSKRSGLFGTSGYSHAISANLSKSTRAHIAFLHFIEYHPTRRNVGWSNPRKALPLIHAVSIWIARAMYELRRTLSLYFHCLAVPIAH